MKSILLSVTINDIFCFFLCAFAFSLPFSNYALSVSMFGMCACIIFNDTKEGIKWNFKIFNDLTLTHLHPVYISWIFIFLSVTLSYFWSTDQNRALQYIRDYTPFLVLPFTFSKQGKLNSYQIQLIAVSGILSMVVQLSLVLWNYKLNYQDLNLAMLKGQVIPTPGTHISFSLILALDILFLIYFLIHRKFLFNKSELIIYSILAVYFIFGLHILSVKSGILGFYFGLSLLLYMYFKQKNKSRWLLLLFPSLVILLVLMISFIPSLNSKFYFILWQIEEYKQGNYRFFSDIERWQSYEFAWRIIKENPILGTGIGDLSNETDKIYLKFLNSTDTNLAHNQFLYSWAYCGIFGLLSLIMLFYFSLIRPGLNRNMLSLGLLGLILTFMLVDCSFCKQISLCLSIFIFYISLQLDLSYYKSNE